MMGARAAVTTHHRAGARRGRALPTLTAPAVASANTVPIAGVSAQPKIPGIPVPNVLSPGFAVHTLADGTFPLENPADLVANPVTGMQEIVLDASQRD